MPGGRPATGSARWNPKAKTWEARVSIKGERVPVAVDVPACLVAPTRPAAKCPCASCTQAKRVAKIVSDDYRRNGRVPAGTGLVANEWHTRYVKLHGGLGHLVDQHPHDWRRFVADIIGTTPMLRITPEHIKAIRDRLTKLRLDGKMSSQRTLNIWSDLIKAPFSRAFSDDDPVYGALRVGPFAANPALGIKPPSSKADKEEDERERQTLDPAEALTLLAADDAIVPLSDRRLFAIAIYSGLRPAEIFGLLWSDVRLDEQIPILKVQRGRHSRTLEATTTKNRQSVRDLPIHPELRPLLRAMRDEARNPKANVVPVANAYEIGHAAERLRQAVLAVGIDRDELQHGTDHLKPLDLRSLRTTFATWCSKAGYDSAWISRWLGHKPAGTAAKHYVKAAPSFEDVTLRAVQPGTIGPFPPLPKSLLGFGGVLAREAKMNVKGRSKRRFAWVLNLDADLELAAPHSYTPKRSVREAMQPWRALLAASLLGPDDVLVDESTPPRSARGLAGRAFCPTPRALAMLVRAGAEPEAHPTLDVLRLVNSRAFAASLGATLPGAAFVTERDMAQAMLASSPPVGEGWRVKRNFGMTGRGQRVVVTPTEADLAFVRAGLDEGGVQIEPNVAIDAEYAMHGLLTAAGALELGEPVRQRCDARGAWVATEPLLSPSASERDVIARLVAEASLVAAALTAARYFGPFGVDAYTYRGRGRLDLQPRGEINARYSMGFATGFSGKARS